jgi:hypothetical protein
MFRLWQDRMLHSSGQGQRPVEDGCKYPSALTCAALNFNIIAKTILE